MSFNRIGLDFLGGGMEGAGAGAKVAAATGSAWAVPLMVAGGALNRVLAGQADAPAEQMQMRLGSQNIQLNDLQIEAQRRAGDEQRKALKKNRMLQDAVSAIFSRYNALGKGGAA